MSKAADRLLSGKAWDDFCEVIRRAGHSIDRWKVNPDPLERAEWYRFMTRLMRNGVERFIENREAYRPRLRDASWRSSINVQSPDQDHLLCEFNGVRDLKITGNRGGAPYFVIAVWSAAQPASPGAEDWAEKGFDGLKEFDPATLRTTGFLPSQQIAFKDNGDFEVILSENPQPGNWVKLEKDSVGALVRVVYLDRKKEAPPVMRIARVDGERPRAVTPEDIADGLALSAQEVMGYANLVWSWWNENLSHRPNQVRYSQTTYLSNGGVADRHFAFGVWEKGPDEALAITFTPPECEHWIFQLCNIWQENLDNYEEDQGRITKFSATYEKDGSVRVVIAEENPGIGGNWIDSYGHVRGVMGLRLILTTKPPPITLHRLPLEKLKVAGWRGLNPADAIKSGEITA
ncbi:MAG: hypothetical protein K2P94_11990 [Rhodospirillaceae bacterium]|nr:hypothetical protein [Rhodospirillaceae bacterium]